MTVSPSYLTDISIDPKYLHKVIVRCYVMFREFFGGDLWARLSRKRGGGG